MAELREELRAHMDRKIDQLKIELKEILQNWTASLGVHNQCTAEEGRTEPDWRRGVGLGGGYPGMSGLGEMEFPEFSGADVEGWLYWCQQFFEFDPVLEDSKIKFASIHLEDKALYWHHQFMRTMAVQGTYPC